MPVALIVGTLAVFTTLWTFPFVEHPAGVKRVDLAAPSGSVPLEEATDENSSTVAHTELATAAPREDQPEPDTSAIDLTLAPRTGPAVSPDANARNVDTMNSPPAVKHSAPVTVAESETLADSGPHPLETVAQNPDPRTRSAAAGQEQHTRGLSDSSRG